MQQNPRHDDLTNRILAILTEHANTAFTVQDLVEERHIFSSRPLIQKSLSGLLREGMVKVRNKGNEPGYQITTVQKKKPAKFA